MKKIFYILLVTFFVSGVGLFYLIDKNYETISKKYHDKFQNSVETGEIVIGNGQSDLETIEKEFTENLKKIDVNIGVGDMEIRSYEGKTIKIKGEISKKSLNKFETKVDGETLTIKGTVVHKLLVEIPKSMILDGKIYLGVGDCKIENLKNGDIVINTGNFEGKNLTDVENIKVDLGDLELIGAKNIKKVKLGTGSGKIELLEQKRDFSIENNLGDMELKITNKFEGSLDNNVKLGDLSVQNLNTVGGKLKGTLNVDLGSLTVTGIE